MVGFYVDQYRLSAWAEQFSKYYKCGIFMYVDLPVLWISMCENGNL